MQLPCIELRFLRVALNQNQASLFEQTDLQTDSSNEFKQRIHAMDANEQIPLQVTVDWFLDGSFGHPYRGQAVISFC